MKSKAKTALEITTCILALVMFGLMLYGTQFALEDLDTELDKLKTAVVVCERKLWTRTEKDSYYAEWYWSGGWLIEGE